MRGGLLVKEARLRAGVTQAELAERLGTAQPVIARWESGTNEPKFTSVVEAVRACGLDLRVVLCAGDDADQLAIAGRLARTAAGRLDANRAMLDFERLAQTARVVRPLAESDG
ncbi:MAG: helix-turn-helix transcriptional regulator [Egibacteraceae bacterium]